MQEISKTRRAILLAEDDPDIADMLSECLRGEGYAVTLATNGTAAVEALDTKEFALVLADAFANQGSKANRWVEVERIRRAAGTTPTVICTAHRSQEFSEFAERGFAAVLAKPFDLDDLLTLVHRLTDPTDEPRPDESRDEGATPRSHAAAPPHRKAED